MLVPLTNGQSLCPSPSKFAPCTCTGNGEGTGLLDCGSKNLGDDLAGEILNASITPQSLTLLYRIHLGGNKLTRVPNQISTFRQLTYVDLSISKITSVKAEAFNFV